MAALRLGANSTCTKQTCRDPDHSALAVWLKLKHLKFAQKPIFIPREQKQGSVPSLIRCENGPSLSIPCHHGAYIAGGSTAKQKPPLPSAALLVAPTGLPASSPGACLQRLGQRSSGSWLFIASCLPIPTSCSQKSILKAKMNNSTALILETVRPAPDQHNDLESKFSEMRWRMGEGQVRAPSQAHQAESRALQQSPEAKSSQFHPPQKKRCCPWRRSLGRDL